MLQTRSLEASVRLIHESSSSRVIGAPEKAARLPTISGRLTHVMIESTSVSARGRSVTRLMSPFIHRGHLCIVLPGRSIYRFGMVGRWLGGILFAVLAACGPKADPIADPDAPADPDA